MPRRRGDTAAMNPLALLVRTRMDERRWSSYDVERHGGPPASTVLRIADPKISWRQPPRQDTLERLAKALELPLARVQQAAIEAVGYRVGARSTSDHIALVVAAMQDLPADKQRRIADMVLNMVEMLRDADGPR